jgi:hypothetical protein
MKMLKPVATAVAVIGLASVMAWQYVSNENLRRDNEGLKQVLAELKKLSDAPSVAATEGTVTEEQRDELLKLRAEVTQLRTQTNQIVVLTEANQKLRASLSAARAPQHATSSTKKGPQDALPQDIHPRETWAFRGYSTPEATMESVLSAMLNGDKAACLRGFSPDLVDEIDQQFSRAMERAKDDVPSEFRILDRKPLSEDEVVISVYVSSSKDTGGHAEDTVFRKIGGEWKVTKKQPPQN